MKKFCFCMAGLFFVLVASPLNAASMDANSIFEKMKNVWESSQVSEKMNIIVKNRDQKTTGILIAGAARKSLPDGRRAVMVLLEPESLKGVAYLVREMADGTIDQWVYPPYLGRVRKISRLSAYDSFLNTDFTYADLGFIEPKSKVKLLGEETLDGLETYKIELFRDENNYYYSRMIIWVSKESFLPVRRDFYDLSNTLWKRQLYERVTVVNGVPMPLRVRMLDLKAKTSTEMNITEVNSDIDLPDEMFVPEQLQESLKCPVWEKVCYSVEK